MTIFQLNQPPIADTPTNSPPFLDCLLHNPTHCTPLDTHTHRSTDPHGAHAAVAVAMESGTGLKERKYDPPSDVVTPAFMELLTRLQRARLCANPDPNLAREERLLFDHGVTQRRRVLEHTLFLVFAQWALYRQAVTRLPSSKFPRPLRIGYAVAAAASSFAFMRRRATAVTADLFAHVVTAPSDSALANEARIVLAELEGPDGPYFAAVTRDRDISPASLLRYDNNNNDGSDGGDMNGGDGSHHGQQGKEEGLRLFANSSYDTDAAAQHAHQHPQLHLTPRLLTPNVLAAPPHPHIVPPHLGARPPGAAAAAGAAGARVSSTFPTPHGTPPIPASSSPQSQQQQQQSQQVQQMSRIRRRGFADLPTATDADIDAAADGDADAPPPPPISREWRRRYDMRQQPHAGETTTAEMHRGYNGDGGGLQAEVDDGGTGGGGTGGAAGQVDDGAWGQPFDFSKGSDAFAARPDDTGFGLGGGGSGVEDDEDEDRADVNMTPSQRRAAARRRRRLQAQTQARARAGDGGGGMAGQGSDDGDINWRGGDGGRV